MLRIALGILAVLVVVGAVAPLRRLASDGLSRVIFWVASPMTPSVHGFGELPQRSRVVAADGSELGRIDGTQGSQPVALSALPAIVPHAVLAAEDANFYHHSGVDPAALARAALSTIRGRTEGGSTITQQLAKLDYTGSQRTVFRKVRELLYAVRLEKNYTKDQLLEQYLNQVYFGDGAYGIAAAAQTYFGVGPDKLTVAQAAALAGKIHAPTFLDPYRRPQDVVQRRNQVLNAMTAHHWIDHQQLNDALAAPLQVVPKTSAPGSALRYFLSYVQGEVMSNPAFGGSPESRAKQLFTGGYTVQTTFDRKAFEAAVAAAHSRLGKPGDPTTAIASVQPGDGAIHVLFGGLDTTQQFDIASQGRRQPGSSFKPFVYLSALREGIDPRSTLDSSSPQTLHYQGQTFTVVNYEGEGGGGAMSIDDALVHSVNTVYAQLGLKVGPQQVVNTAQDDGIHPGIAPVPAVSLGGLNQGVSPLEMAAAYATFAARGLYASPYSVASIVDRHGHPVFHHAPQTKQVFETNQVGVLTATLERVVTEGTATAAAIGRPVAGKTGTTSNYTDAWFVGFVPQLATAVWVGDPAGNTPMTHVHGVAVSGGSYPATMFADMMKAALDGTPVQPLFTATPDSLSLHPLQSTAPVASTPTSSTSSSSTSSTTPGSTTTSTTEAATTTTPTSPPTTVPTASTTTPTTPGQSPARGP
ncbi:MAG TPA: transglycosylase domain-containing protein [Acidimicrobiales bacterium]|nr:transglycosylase domain-containing protein [Acidimicrobiales bacterium]